MSNAVDRPGLAVVEQVVEPRVRLLRGPEAGELPHRPEPTAIHRRVDAARERIRARVAEVALVVDLDRVGRLERLVLDPRDRGEELAFPFGNGVVQLLAPRAGCCLLPRLGGRHAGILPDVLRRRPKSSSLHPVGGSPARGPEPAREAPSGAGTRRSRVRAERGRAAVAEGLRAAASRATPPRRSSRGRAARRHCRGSARAARDAVPEPEAHRGRDGFEQLRECAPRPARRSSPERRSLRRRRCARSAARARADLPARARDVPARARQPLRHHRPRSRSVEAGRR